MSFSPFTDALIGNFIGSLVGALAGAGAVLFYEACRRKREHAELQHSKLLRAQLVLADKINSITNLKSMLDQIPKETDPVMVPKMLYTMVDEHLSTSDLEPMINGQWADQAAEILRCDGRIETLQIRSPSSIRKRTASHVIRTLKSSILT